MPWFSKVLTDFKSENSVNLIKPFPKLKPSEVPEFQQLLQYLFWQYIQYEFRDFWWQIISLANDHLYQQLAPLFLCCISLMSISSWPYQILLLSWVVLCLQTSVSQKQLLINCDQITYFLSSFKFMIFISFSISQCCFQHANAMCLKYPRSACISAKNTDHTTSSLLLDIALAKDVGYPYPKEPTDL